MLLRVFTVAALWASQVSCAKHYLPRATSSFVNSTLSSTASSSVTTGMPLCCYLDSFNVGQLLWYTSSVEITVATVSTIVYKYNNTAVTSYSTVFSNNTIPTGLLDREVTTISGVPTTIIGDGVGGYQALTTMVVGTVFTDPYGVEYTSPTPVWIYNDVTYRTSQATPTGTGYACPTYAVGFGTDGYMTPYPHGYYSVDPDPNYGQGNQGELFTQLPEGLKDWLVNHVPPNTDTIWSHIGGCTLGFGDGIPTAHVPVNALTVNAVTTTTVNGNLGSTVQTTTSVTPQSEVAPPSSSAAPAPPVTTTTPVVVAPTTTTPVVVAPTSSAAGENPSITQSPQPSTSAVVAPQPSSAGGQSPSAAPAPSNPTNGGGSGPSQDPNPVGSGSTTIGNGAGSVPISNPVVQGGSTTAVGDSNSVSGNPTVPPGSQVTGNAGTTTAPAPGNSQGNPGSTPTTTANTVAPVITVGGTTIVGNSQSNFIIGSSTLTPGGTVIVAGSGTASPTTFVLPTSGSAVIVNGNTQTVQQTTIPATVAATLPAAIFTAGGSTITANSASGFVIGGSTLTPGGTLVIPASGTGSATTYILPSTGGAVIINGATQTLITPTPTATTPLLVLGGTTYTANSAGGFVIGSQTLTRGGVITANGATLSLATAGGTVIEVSGGVTSTESLGGVIASVGGFATSAPAYVTASGAERVRERVSWILGTGLGAGILGVLML